MRILYVDDDATVRRAVATWLTRRGHEVVVADSVGNARAQLERMPADAVILDVNLGAESGLEVHDWIAEHRPELVERVVFVTGEVVHSSRADNALRMLGRWVLAKPFDLHEMDEVLASLGPAPPRAEGDG